MTAATSDASTPFADACWRMMSSWASGSASSRTTSGSRGMTTAAAATASIATPQVNISYGVYYLRYLLRQYGENKVLALAAYNGGEGNVNRWIAQAALSERAFGIEQIPFKETREYVGRVLDAQADYRRKYRRELGL